MSLILEFPKGFNFSQIFITIDNGRSAKKIHFNKEQSKIIIKDSFYSKYAAIQINYQIPNEPNSYHNKSFFISNKFTSIKFGALSKDIGEVINNYTCQSCIDFSKVGEAKMLDYTAQSAHALTNFLKEFPEFERNDTLRIVFDSLNKLFYNKELEFIKTNSSMYSSLWVFRTQYAYNTTIPTDTLLTFFSNNFNDKFKKSVEGKEIISIIKGRLLANGQKAPDFETYDLSKKTITLKKYHNKKVLLHFWASWCAPCIQEIEHIKKIKSLYDTSKLIILSFTKDTDFNDYIKAINKYSMNWTQIFASESILNKYNITFIPQMFLIDENGIIIYKHDDEENEDTALSKLSQLISK